MLAFSGGIEEGRLDHLGIDRQAKVIQGDVFAKAFAAAFEHGQSDGMPENRAEGT
jgi:hypothetical protein